MKSMIRSGFSMCSTTRGARVIATFGPARLVQVGRRAVELQGGTPAELVAAKEWISLFRHEAVLRGARP